MGRDVLFRPVSLFGSPTISIVAAPASRYAVAMPRRRIGLAIVAVLAVLAFARHPSASIQILTHDAGDPAPHRFQAGVDLGVVVVNLLWTWTGHTR